MHKPFCSHSISRFLTTLCCLLSLTLFPLHPSVAQESYSESQSEPEESAIVAEKAAEKASEKDAENNQQSEVEQRPPPDKPRIKPPLPLEQVHDSDLTYYESAEQLFPLLTGEDGFISIQQPQTTGNARGVVILIPDWQQHLANPKAMTQLRKEFPKHGWHVIGVQPPHKPEAFPRISGLEEDIQANEQDLSNYKNALTARLNTVLENAQNFPGVILVVAEGINAALLSDVFLPEANQKPSALVSLSAYTSSEKNSRLYAKALAETEFPVLDLYLDKDNHYVQHASKMRKVAAQKNLKALFRQRMIYGQGHHYPSPELSRQIFGWLGSLGW